MPDNQLEYDKIKEFLREDLGHGDITSMTLIPSEKQARARLYFKEPGVASGLEEAAMVFQILGCNVESWVSDGDQVEADQTLMSVEGSAVSLLMAERTALNIVARMAGIATKTRDIIGLANVHGDVRIAATRKTVPGLRVLDKKAVVHGGGDTHRLRLDDCVLIKDNHLELVSSITDAVKTVRDKISFTKKIEVEVGSIAEAEEAALAGADIIMLDNMGPDDIRDCLSVLEGKGLREGILFEASGNITADNVADYAGSGVDIISMGSLTHSVHSLDVKLKIEMI